MPAEEFGTALLIQFLTRVIKKGAHQIARARESSLGLQARTYLKLTAGVKGERARMPVFKATLLELPLSSALMISSVVESHLSLPARQSLYKGSAAN